MGTAYQPAPAYYQPQQYQRAPLIDPSLFVREQRQMQVQGELCHQLSDGWTQCY
jgi:hypothetical protein